MIYSKTGKSWSNDYEFKIIDRLPKKVDLSENNVTYYHHPYDSLFHGVNFINAVNPIHIEHIKSNPTVMLVHENTSEAIDSRFAEEVYQFISQNNINPSQIKIITADDNHKSFLKTYLESKQVFGTVITVTNILLSNVKQVPEDIEEKIITTKKFSSLSRNYKDWRLFLYKELIDKDLLEHFAYSFHNIWPYTDTPKVFTVDQMINDLIGLNATDLSKEFLKWLKRCPHEIIGNNSGDVKNKWSNITYDAICSADFHLMIETHFDQRSFTGQFNFDRSFGPSSITEKAYKVISCTRPFIVFATPYFLEDLQNLGYKTFSPYINEHYDAETDNHKRLNMIVEEVNRICNLSKDNYTELVKNCRDIAKYNYKHFLSQKINFKKDA